MVAERDRPSSEVMQEREGRWSDVLQEVHDASRTGRRWYEELGVFAAWAFGIGTSAALITFLLVLIVVLISPGLRLNGTIVSDWLFWASALLLFSGLLAPSASDLADSTQKRNEKKRKKTNFSVTRRTSSSAQAADLSTEQDQRSAAERRSDAVRKRLMRVYNPWRWRLWASAVVSFGFSMLAGLVA
jgi:hypothetical protein